MKREPCLLQAVFAAALAVDRTSAISACGHLADYPVLLYCLLNRWSRFLQVFKCHSWVKLNAGIECQEPRLSDCRDLRGVLKIDTDQAGSLAVLLIEIGGFRFLRCED